MTTPPIDVYGEPEDLYDHGLPPGMLAHRARLCGSVLASTDAFELDSHGLSNDRVVTFRAEDGGTLPDPIVAGAPYFAIVVTDATFKVAAAAGGAPIDLTTNGVSVLMITEPPVLRTMERYSRFVDSFIPHVAPLKPPYPPEIVAIVCELSATKLMSMEGQRSEALDRAELAAKAQLERFATGIKVRDQRATASSNLAISGSAADPRGWGSSGGTIP
jgi:hypothetical protein